MDSNDVLFHLQGLFPHISATDVRRVCEECVFELPAVVLRLS